MAQELNIQELLRKFIKNECNKQETETLISYFKDIRGTENLPSLNEVKLLLDEFSIDNQHKSQANSTKILQEAKRREKTILVKSIWKYAAAAILVIALASTYLLKDQIFSSTIKQTVPIIVNNQILSGTEKATLTLESGEIVALEKGSAYQNSYANSNGEAIVYGKKAHNTSLELVNNYLTIPRGGQFQLTLSDGTRVWLNSETQLKYPVGFTDGESRRVELVYGEAYFEVSPSTEHNGSDFRVYNNNQEVEVLGTKFNIKAYRDETNIYTTLVEGKVAVNIENQNKILKPGEQLNFNEITNILNITTVDVYDQISWKEGVFSFKRKTLKDIMQVLSRWYDMDVVFKNKELEAAGFNGVVGKEQSIREILETIKGFGVIKNYEINNKTITLK